MPGLIHIYCGDGKGKTTAALGLAVREAGSGQRVLLLQFLKDGKSSEFAALARIPQIETVPQTQTFGFTWTLTPEEKREAAAYYAALLEEAFRRAEDFDLLVLDEALGACAAGLLDEARLLSLLDGKPEPLEIVLTGRNPSQDLRNRAHYVSEIKMVKHPFQQGVSARRGIEY